MDEHNNQNKPIPQTKSSSAPWSALKWILIGLGALFLAIIIFLSYQGYQLYKQVSPYLSAERSILPKMEYTDDDIVAMEEKLALLREPDNHGSETISFSSAEINLILKEKFDLAKQMRVTLHDERLHLDYTFPFPIGGKHINGNMEMRSVYENGQLDLRITEGFANDKQLEEPVVNTLEDTLENIVREHILKSAGDIIKSIIIKDSNVYITFDTHTEDPDGRE